MEKTNNTAVDYATVILFDKKDSSFVAGTITNSTGKFTIKEVPYGLYFLNCKFLGFYKVIVSDININSSAANFRLDTIKLESATQNLDEVIISEDRKTIEYQIEKKVINVNNDLNYIGGTAVDILENTPSIQTDIEGNVKLRGSSSFTLLIDGAPTVMNPSKELKLIPAGIIKQIEIITNPSAKYDPDGIGGLINIITKKQKKTGINGLISASAATRQQYSGDILLNYKTNKFKIFGSFGFYNKHYIHTGIENRELYFRDTVLITENNLKTDQYHENKKFKTGIDYYINKKITIGISGKYDKRGYNFEIISKFNEYEIPYTYNKYSIHNKLEDYSGDYYILNFNYDHKFDSDDHKLTANSYLSIFDGKEINNLNISTTNSAWNVIDLYPVKQRSTKSINHKTFRFKTDYSRPVGEKGMLETGCQIRFVNDSSRYNANEYSNNFNKWLDDTLQSNIFIYTKNINSIYSTITNKHEKIEYKLGLRIEYFNRLTKQVSINEEHKIDRFDFFPTFHLLYKPSGTHQFQASYSRRVFRLWGTYLNPFPIYKDSYNIHKGNPYLKPEYIDSYELSYFYHFKSSYLSTEFYYRQTNNKINFIQTLDDDIMLHSYKNLNKDYTLGIPEFDT